MCRQVRVDVCTDGRRQPVVCAVPAQRQRLPANQPAKQRKTNSEIVCMYTHDCLTTTTTTTTTPPARTRRADGDPPLTQYLASVAEANARQASAVRRCGAARGDDRRTDDARCGDARVRVQVRASERVRLRLRVRGCEKQETQRETQRKTQRELELLAWSPAATI